jgi:hypothetical protein
MRTARALTVALAAASFGCGLDLQGSASGDGGVEIDGGADATSGDGAADASTSDAPSVGDASSDQFVPPPCVDTSCLGAAVPSGWSLLGVTMGAKACPSSDFDSTPLVTNPRLKGDACACAACMTQGSYTCSGAALAFGPTCQGAPTSITSNSQCVANSQMGNNAKVSVTPSPPSGSVTCTIAGAGSGGVDTDPMSACIPNKCTANYCGLRMAGFTTCIAHDGAMACPTGFPHATSVGSAGVASCTPCACTVTPATCPGIFRVFDNVTNCDLIGTGIDQKGGDFPADGTCQNPNSNFDSVYYLAGFAPQPACTPNMRTAGSGTAGLSAQKTVCCTQ